MLCYVSVSYMIIHLFAHFMFLRINAIICIFNLPSIFDITSLCTYLSLFSSYYSNLKRNKHFQLLHACHASPVFPPGTAPWLEGSNQQPQKPKTPLGHRSVVLLFTGKHFGCSNFSFSFFHFIFKYYFII